MRLAAASGTLGWDAACAVWYPSGVPDTCASDHELEHYAERFTLSGQIMHDRHPDRPPPAYLMLLGARPEAQGVYSRAGYRPLGAPSQFPEGLEVYPFWRDPQPGVAVA